MGYCGDWTRRIGWSWTWRVVPLRASSDQHARGRANAATREEPMQASRHPRRRDVDVRRMRRACLRLCDPDCGLSPECVPSHPQPATVMRELGGDRRGWPELAPARFSKLRYRLSAVRSDSCMWRLDENYNSIVRNLQTRKKRLVNEVC